MRESKGEDNETGSSLDRFHTEEAIGGDHVGLGLSIGKGKEIDEDLRRKIRKKATESAKKTRRHRHLIPILAGIAVVLLILFLQYNRLIFAPIMAYVSPGNAPANAHHS